MIKIESGVIQLPDGSYRYIYWEAAGLDDDGMTNMSRFHNISFTVEPGEVPEIGDFISNNKLVKRDGYQVTEGKMRWPTEYSDNTIGWTYDDEPPNGWDKTNR